MTPTLICFVVFKYMPLWNAQIAFKDFKPLLGVWVANLVMRHIVDENDGAVMVKAFAYDLAKRAYNLE